MNNKRPRNSHQDEEESNASKRLNLEQSNGSDNSALIEANTKSDQLDGSRNQSDEMTEEAEKEQKADENEQDNQKAQQQEEDDDEEEEDEATELVNEEETEVSANPPTEQTGSTPQVDTSEQNNQTSDSSASTAVFSNGDWQAIYDYQQAAYYYVNSKTGESTWQNPFENPTTTSNYQAETQDTLNGIDPELAYLDSRLSGSSSSLSFKAQFNSKTGQFQSTNLNPNRFSEVERSRTQAKAYFDVEGWEKSLEKSNGKLTGTSKDYQNKFPTKLSSTELSKFKEQKLKKKIKRQTDWLKS